MAKENAENNEKNKRRKKPIEIPPMDLVEKELKRERYKLRFSQILRSTIYSLIVVAAIAVLVATIWLPVLRIYGSSMTPTLSLSLIHI